MPVNQTANMSCLTNFRLQRSSSVWCLLPVASFSVAAALRWPLGFSSWASASIMTAGVTWPTSRESWFPGWRVVAPPRLLNGRSERVSEEKNQRPFTARISCRWMTTVSSFPRKPFQPFFLRSFLTSGEETSAESASFAQLFSWFVTG